ncbi:MAG: hypothetical protein PWQ10_529 [Patescibacteria group bacterium]|nr:hypothetical protein [Patescibacteria group bacterium]
MNIKVASWNIEKRLENFNSKRRGNSAQIIEMINLIDADIIVLPEAHDKSSLDNLRTKDQLNNMGYYIYNMPYDDSTNPELSANNKHLSLLLLTRLKVIDIKIVKLGNFRNTIIATFDCDNEKRFKVVGVHLDDKSEETRVKQINDLSKIINQTNIPTLIMGDFNAMHGEDLWPAKFLQSKFIKKLAKLIWPSVFIRTTEMAIGNTLKILEDNTNLIDIDKSHRPTTTPKMSGHEWLPSLRLIQIDHIFTSKDIKSKNFHIYKNGGSDHRAISANVYF